LIEYCLTAVILCLVIVLSYERCLQAAFTYGRITSDLELYRAERAAFSLVRQEICFYAETVELQEDGAGNPVIVCQEPAPRRKVTYYTQSQGAANNVLYQKTKVEGKNAGINPLTPPDVTVTAWYVRKMTGNGLLIGIVLKEKKTGREKEFVEAVELGNGKVI